MCSCQLHTSEEFDMITRSVCVYYLPGNYDCILLQCRYLVHAGQADVCTFNTVYRNIHWEFVRMYVCMYVCVCRAV